MKKSTVNNALSMISSASLRLTVLLCVLFMSAFFVCARAHENSASSTRIYFPFDNSAVSESYLDNLSTLIKIDRIASKAKSTDVFTVTITSYSSPEGSFAYNKALSARRAAALRDFIVERHPFLEGHVTVRPGGEAWDAVREAVLSDSSLGEGARKAMLDIIDSNADPDIKEARLKGLDSYKRFYTSHFRHFRYSEVSFEGSVFDEARARVSESEGEIVSESSSVAEARSAAPEVQNADSASANTRVSSYARTGRLAGTDSTHVLFGVGEYDVNPDFAGNGAAIAGIASQLDILNAESFESLIVTSGSSIDGPVSMNDRCSWLRGRSLVEWIENNYPQYKGRITLNSRGEDWAQLREDVVSDNRLDKEAKYRILAIIDSNDSAAAKEARLRRLPEWDYLLENILPLSRYASVRASLIPVMEEPAAAEEEPVATEEQPAVADTASVAPVISDEPEAKDSTIVVNPVEAAPEAVKPSVERHKPGIGTLVAVKTNLLYDALTALNLEIEVPIGRRFSLSFEDVFPWWETGNKYCFQMWEMGAEARFWFKPWEVEGRDKLRGWFLGVYGMSSKFDFQNDKSFNYQGEYWSVGGTIGYSTPIGRSKWGNLEFSVSTGYLEAPYRHYYPTDDYVKLIKDPAGDGTLYSYFLYPTKAKVSLVVPIPGPRKKEVSHE